MSEAIIGYFYMVWIFTIGNKRRPADKVSIVLEFGQYEVNLLKYDVWADISINCRSDITYWVLYPAPHCLKKATSKYTI